MPMNGKIIYSLRIASVEDAATIADLGRRTFSATFTLGNDPDDIRAYINEAFTPERILAELEEPESSYLLVMDGDKIAGYGRIRPGEAPPSVGDANAVELERIYIDEPWLGKGAGAFLMSALLAEARKRGCQSVWLGVWEHNHQAIHFYEKYGLAVVGKKRFLLGGDKQTDLVMSGKLD
ncbi:MAG: GNAT family N-acetyltransferase [Gammaproteobacteria bacterium]|nr:GNAT family N-acetyltransferase [Gammaproteobacteria bacterium]